MEWKFKRWLANKLSLATHEDWQELESRVYELERFHSVSDAAFDSIVADMNNKIQLSVVKDEDD